MVLRRFSLCKIELSATFNLLHAYTLDVSIFAQGMIQAAKFFIGMFPYIVWSYNYSYQAFCRKSTDVMNFPLQNPPRHIPWVWDASIHPSNNSVVVNILSRNACKFNFTLWKRLSEKYPEIRDQIAGGFYSNVLVPVDNDYNYAGAIEGSHGSQRYLWCAYLLGDLVVSRVRSKIILDFGSQEMSTRLIKCDLPENLTWDRMQLEKDIAYIEIYGQNRDNSTDTFPVCPLNQIYQDMNLTVRKFNLAICTATARGDRDELVEWIEYYKLMGVEHFFLYNTMMLKRKRMDLSRTLSDYIAEGYVTIIPWPYANCVDGMASGRWTGWPEIGVRGNVYFFSPRAIAQTAALASCYARFKHTTKWMAHVDDDEFLVFDFDKEYSGGRFTNLVEFADSYDARHPNLSAVYFRPVQVTPCISRESFLRQQHIREIQNSSRLKLPRFGKWRGARLGVVHEGKMIMKTEAVGMFYVHYLTLIEDGGWNMSAYVLPYSEAALLHYKLSQEYSGSISGSILPLDLGKTPFSCKGRMTDSYNLEGNLVHQTMSRPLVPLLRNAYRARLLQSDLEGVS